MVIQDQNDQEISLNLILNKFKELNGKILKSLEFLFSLLIFYFGSRMPRFRKY